MNFNGLQLLVHWDNNVKELINFIYAFVLYELFNLICRQKLVLETKGDDILVGQQIFDLHRISNVATTNFVLA